jgi:hypothetical protein
MTEAIFKGTPGESIRSFCQSLIEAWESVALSSHEALPVVMGEFNGVLLTCRAESTVEGLIQEYLASSEAQAEAYRQSPAGRATVRLMEDYRTDLQIQINSAMAELPSLNFHDLAVVIEWFKRIQEGSDHIYVHTPSREIVETFLAQGYEIGVNCGEAFDETSADNYGRWLIGQALQNLSTLGAIHQVYHKFSDEWRERFTRDQ